MKSIVPTGEKEIMTDSFPELKNDLLLRALGGDPVERPPVWMMRQAGRYLPEYRRLQEKYSFFERCETPELAAEITLQPIDRLGMDAAILFSDILVVAQALDFRVTIEKGNGPLIHNPVQAVHDVDRLHVPDVSDRLHYVMDAIILTRQNLSGRVPLIGFAGAPWTIFCYLVEGHGSRNFSRAKQFCYQNPEAAGRLLNIIAQTTAEYLQAQIDAGAQALQLFDSWAGLLSPGDFSRFSWPYIQYILDHVKGAPIIVFAKGSWYALESMAESGAALGLDWTIPPEYARKVTKGQATLQGNFDPGHLLSPIPAIKDEVNKMIRQFGRQRYIVNLGHGILPDTPVDHARAFVDAVKEYQEHE